MEVLFNVPCLKSSPSIHGLEDIELTRLVHEDETSKKTLSKKEKDFLKNVYMKVQKYGANIYMGVQATWLDTFLG